MTTYFVISKTTYFGINVSLLSIIQVFFSRCMQHKITLGRLGSQTSNFIKLFTNAKNHDFDRQNVAFGDQKLDLPQKKILWWNQFVRDCRLPGVKMDTVSYLLSISAAASNFHVVLLTVKVRNSKSEFHKKIVTLANAWTMSNVNFILLFTWTVLL